MVEFRFDIKTLFPQPIIKVTSNLLPHTFRGDRRQCLDATSKMSEIIDRLGQLSATSQGLSKPVTTAQRLRMSENQTIYLLADPDAGHNGLVTGLLKVGTKDLYLFDEGGQTRKVDQAPCILDFYVHESRQRAGLGKRLFETMLAEEHWTPLKCSVDRPSEKLLAFLSKHYGLVRIIPQANNFVLYEGFFGAVASTNGNGRASQQSNGGLHITNSPNTQLFGATYLGEDIKRGRRSSGGQQQQSMLHQITQISPSGRYGAPRPTCSMAESRQATASAAAATAPTMARKYASEVSLTPSQKREAENPRKSPLDALSRSNYRMDPLQKRSGLQDVDDAFMSSNAFMRPSRMRNSGLDTNWTTAAAGSSGAAAPTGQAQAAPAAVAPIRLAGGNAEPIQFQQQQPPAAQSAGQQQQQQPLAAQPTSQQQQQLSQAQQPPPVAAVPSQQQLQQQQQSYMQQPAAGTPSARPEHGGRAHVPQQPQQQSYEQQQQQQQQQQEAQPQPSSPRKYQQQQQAGGYIIHAGSSKSKAQGGGSAESSSGGNDDIDAIAAQLQQLHYVVSEVEPEPEPEPELEPQMVIVIATPPRSRSHTPTPPEVRSAETAESIIGSNRRPPAFQLSKQHTGMKNRSFGVGMAVMPSGKMEFDQLEREDFGVVKINRPIGNVTSPGQQDNADAMSTVSSQGVTDQGYNDLKFFHNKLW